MIERRSEKKKKKCRTTTRATTNKFNKAKKKKKEKKRYALTLLPTTFFKITSFCCGCAITERSARTRSQRELIGLLNGADTT